MLESKIEELITPAVQSLGYEIVRLKFITNKTLQVMIERQDAQPIAVADCIKVNNAISPILDVEDLIGSEYTLEVSSPGIDRPLVKLKDFDTYKENKVQIAVKIPVEEVGNFSGVLRGLNNEDVIIELENKRTITLEFHNIKSARLVVNI